MRARYRARMAFSVSLAGLAAAAVATVKDGSTVWVATGSSGRKFRIESGAQDACVEPRSWEGGSGTRGGIRAKSEMERVGGTRQTCSRQTKGNGEIGCSHKGYIGHVVDSYDSQDADAI